MMFPRLKKAIVFPTLLCGLNLKSADKISRDDDAHVAPEAASLLEKPPQMKFSSRSTSSSTNMVCENGVCKSSGTHDERNLLGDQNGAHASSVHRNMVRQDSYPTPQEACSACARDNQHEGARGCVFAEMGAVSDIPGKKLGMSPLDAPFGAMQMGDMRTGMGSLFGDDMFKDDPFFRSSSSFLETDASKTSNDEGTLSLPAKSNEAQTQAPSSSFVEMSDVFGGAISAPLGGGIVTKTLPALRNQQSLPTRDIEAIKMLNPSFDVETMTTKEEPVPETVAEPVASSTLEIRSISNPAIRDVLRKEREKVWATQKINATKSLSHAACDIQTEFVNADIQNGPGMQTDPKYAKSIGCDAMQVHNIFPQSFSIFLSGMEKICTCS